MRDGVGMVRSSLVSVSIVVGLACGPAVELDFESESGTGSATVTDPTEPGESVDESGQATGPCGVGETELFGGGPPGPLGFPPPCNPQQDPGTNGYRCCSDDPATIGGMLPAYQGLGIQGGAPLFAEANNDFSDFGMCVHVEELAGSGLQAAGVEGCPIPCNPTWPPDSIVDVCGTGRRCCQTVELQPEDCVQDADSGLWRPVTGNDIGEPDSSGNPVTLWRPQDHATHQDPNGVDCLAFATGDSTNEVFQGCVRALSVANQRGYCMTLGADQQCPHTLPDYLDACEQLNG